MAGRYKNGLSKKEEVEGYTVKGSILISAKKWTELAIESSRETFIEINPIRSHYQYEKLLTRRQDEIMRALKNQIADGGQKLFEKVRQMEQHEKDLEVICKELFLEVNIR